MVGVLLSSVTVMVLMAVAEPPTVKAWLAAEEMVGAPMAMVLSSVELAPLSLSVSNSRLSAEEAALKLVNLAPETVIWSSTPKLVVTFRIRVLLIG